MDASWPEIPYAEWAETCAALHLYSQIVGKYRLALTPWVNHSWHATLYVDATGLTTGPVTDGDQAIEVRFDLKAHRLVALNSRGEMDGFALRPGTVADFHDRFRRLIAGLGGTARFNDRPNEVSDPVPFPDDHSPRPYDRDRVERFHRSLVTVDSVFRRFRTGFLGKVSPVHLFWGSFDLAVTRFSGRKAPPHPGGIPNLPDEVTREAYSHEVSSAGFWPGGGGPIDYPAFYSYAYPPPPGFADAGIEPGASFFSKDLGEFILPYEAVRSSPAPEEVLMRFLQSSYEAAATFGNWDRSKLECPIGVAGKPRIVPAPAAAAAD